MKGCMDNMYALISEYEYPEQFCFIASNPAELEEMALSLFEEDWYEWFCSINEDGYFYKAANVEEMKRAAFENALEHSFNDYYITKPVSLDALPA